MSGEIAHTNAYIENLLDLPYMATNVQFYLLDIDHDKAFERVISRRAEKLDCFEDLDKMKDIVASYRDLCNNKTSNYGGEIYIVDAEKPLGEVIRESIDIVENYL